MFMKRETEIFFLTALMSLVAHLFGRVEFRIFVLKFSTALVHRKQQQIFEI